MSMPLVLPQANQEVDIAQLREMNKMLRDSARGLYKAAVGYPQQGVAYLSPSGNEVDPTIAQSIQPVLTNFDFELTDIWFWNQINKVDVTSTLHEYSSIRQHGSRGIQPFFGQGRVGALSEAKYARGVVRVKFAMEYIQLTDVAAMLGTVTGGTVLAQRTMDMTLSLMGRFEQALIWGDSSVNPLAFDGLYTSIKNAHKSSDPAYNGIGVTTWIDIRGELPVASINYFLGTMRAAPKYARPTHILCTPQQYQAFKNQVLPVGRLMLENASNANITFGPGGEMYAVGFQQNVPIQPLMFLEYPQGVSAAALGDSPPTTGTITPAVDAVTGTGQWSASDITGDIYVTLVAQGEGGIAARSTPELFEGGSDITATTDLLQFTIDDDAKPELGEDNSLVFYSAFVAKVASGASAPDDSDYSWVGDFARGGTVGSRTDTVIKLGNEKIPGTAPVIIAQITPDVMQFSQLLDFTRRPITVSRTTTIQFALMLFGSFTNMVPHKNLILDNVSPGWATSYIGYTA